MDVGVSNGGVRVDGWVYAVMKAQRSMAFLGVGVAASSSKGRIPPCWVIFNYRQ